MANMWLNYWIKHPESDRFVFQFPGVCLEVCDHCYFMLLADKKIASIDDVDPQTAVSFNQACDEVAPNAGQLHKTKIKRTISVFTYLSNNQKEIS